METNVKNDQIVCFGEIFSNLSLLVKYLIIYYCFVIRIYETRVSHVTRVLQNRVS